MESSPAPSSPLQDSGPGTQVVDLHSQDPLPKAALSRHRLLRSHREPHLQLREPSPPRNRSNRPRSQTPEALATDPAYLDLPSSPGWTPAELRAIEIISDLIRRGLPLPTDDDDGSYTYSGQERAAPGEAGLRHVRASLASETNVTFARFMELAFTHEDFDKRRRIWVQGEGGPILSQLLAEEGVLGSSEEEALGKVVKMVERETAWMTSDAKAGPNSDDAQALRYGRNPKSVDGFKALSMSLIDVYDRSMPILQRVLAAVKGPAESAASSLTHRLPSIVATSILLFGRSIWSSSFQWLVTFSLEGRAAPRAIYDILNSLGISMSYDQKMAGVKELGRTVIVEAREDLVKVDRVHLLCWDNFNWRMVVYEASRSNQTQNHNSTSGFLLRFFINSTVGTEMRSKIIDALSNPKHWDEKFAKRLNHAPSTVALDLLRIDPWYNFESNAVKHIALTLTRLLPSFSPLSEHPKLLFEDTRAIEKHKSTFWELGTLDQEQGSVSGNHAVIEKFARDLKLGEDWFEKKMLFWAGDQLTWSRNQSLRALLGTETAKSRRARGTSLRGGLGLFHFEMTVDRVIAKFFYGNPSDPLSLGSLASLIGLSQDIHPTKILAYPYRRLLNTVCDADILDAASVFSGAANLDHFKSYYSNPDNPQPIETLLSLAQKIVQTFILPSQGRLEFLQYKKVLGKSVCGTSMERMRVLLLQREFIHAIKVGHPTRFLSAIRLLLPYFAIGNANLYTELTISFLAELEYETPNDAFWIRVANLVLNVKGLANSFLPLDLHNEHLNLAIKKHFGSSLSHLLLNAVTPAHSLTSEKAAELLEEIHFERGGDHSQVKITDETWKVAKRMELYSAHNFDRDCAQPDGGVEDIEGLGKDRLGGNNGAVARSLRRYAISIRRVDGPQEGVPLPDEWIQKWQVSEDSSYEQGIANDIQEMEGFAMDASDKD